MIPVNMQLSEKVVWITGASSGIGRALALALARPGARLILSGRREDRLLEVKNQCRAGEEDIFLLPFDLADLDLLPEKVKQAESHFGRIDVLVNNAGVSQRSRAGETRFSVVKRLLDINFLAAVSITLGVLPGMAGRKSGHIVVVTSLMGKIGTPLRSGYSAAKHALHGFFDSLRAEVWRDNIKVTLVVPGFVRTNISSNSLKGDGQSHGRLDDNQAKGISPEACAAKIIKAIVKSKEELWVGFKAKGRLVMLFKQFFPGLLSRILKKAKVT